ncbi:MAG: response regulator [Gammaproteobacteria bacterium]|nr:response regulator [Gammaproteobacteria bacterium]MYE52374.1 response regulator [Gammaproteobacteria bacterium]
MADRGRRRVTERNEDGNGLPELSHGGDRASALAAAILRISESLDLGTVLREIVEGACSLTGAQLGIVATVDESGFPGERVFSGFSPEWERELEEWPGGLRMVEHLNELLGPLRTADLPGYTRALGLEPTPGFPGAFQGAPVRYRGAAVGYLYLGKKAGGAAFTAADEEVLMLFAAQAAVAIGNARAHRSEQRARMDLEALIDTSPVGVVVFDGRSGRMLSWNREARRIVEGLRTPGRPLEDLLRTTVCRRADGSELSLADLPLVEQFASAGPVRAEEIVVTVADGRSVRTLINATPVRAEGSVTDSVVVTMQDLAPLEEIERQRGEFLGLVSHELRAPLTSIMGSAVTLLDGPEVLDPAEMREFFRIILEQANHMRGLIADLLDAGRIDSGTLSVSPEPTAVTDLVERARSTFLTGDGGRSVVVDLADGLPAVMADRRRIVQVLNNLLANAARHTEPSSVIRVAAVHDGQHVAISVSDDGAGIAPEALAHLFRKQAGGGSGTASHGLGLAICKGLVEAHGGRIRAASEGPGRGATITFTLPAAELGDPAAARAASPTASSPMRGERPRILVVDDDPNTLRFVRDALDEAGYAPLVTGAPDHLGSLIRAESPALVLLDLLLPGRNGLELLQEIPELSDLPVIFISGYGRDETVAKAFELGADDYLVKPFSPTELVARVRAALRRHSDPEPFVLGDLAIRYESREVTVAGEAVDLTATEFELLRLLSVNAGRVVNHDTILQRLWPGRDGTDANLIRIFVRNVRRKLGDSAQEPTWIFSQRGVGYHMPKPCGG